MNSMPYLIKQKIRQLQKTCEKARSLQAEVTVLLEKHGINIDTLLGYCDSNQKYTEALSFVINGEGNVQDNIDDIEEVFLYYVNN